MKVNFDYGYKNLKVPKVFEEMFNEARKEGLKGNDKEWWEGKKEEIFLDWFSEEGISSEYEGKIVDREIARFVIAFGCGTDWGGMGGYPHDTYMEFEDNGFKYTICCFGWANDDTMRSGGGYNFIGYKEKIK